MWRLFTSTGKPWLVSDPLPFQYYWFISSQKLSFEIEITPKQMTTRNDALFYHDLCIDLIARSFLPISHMLRFTQVSIRLSQPQLFKPLRTLQAEWPSENSYSLSNYSTWFLCLPQWYLSLASTSLSSWSTGLNHTSTNLRVKGYAFNHGKCVESSKASTQCWSQIWIDQMTNLSLVELQCCIPNQALPIGFNVVQTCWVSLVKPISESPWCFTKQIRWPICDGS